jgi:signal transduction histidine kinase
VTTLAQSKLFSVLPKEELEQILQAAVERDYADGEVIFKEGDPGNGVFVVKNGRVELSSTPQIATNLVLSTMEPGDFFGEMAVIDEQPRSACAKAVGSCTVYFLDSEVIRRMISCSPAFSMNLLKEISFRLRRVNQKHMRELLQAERLNVIGRFAQSIVHDLKNPLSVLMLALELTNQDQELSPATRGHLELARKQIDRIQDLLGDILEFTQGVSSSIPPKKLAYGDLVNQVAKSIRRETESKDVLIETGAIPPGIELSFDSKRISRVLVNLINNAVELMADGGRVKIEVYVKDDVVVTEVVDNGPGIAPEILPRLFEPFATHGKVKGTGLGLSMCQRIIQDHGGWIRGANRPEGGAVFSFGLPSKRRESAR